ncbi:hypothetical protein [Bartonella sp. AA81SXKL]|uniref:hypothetical protein n=1 Tax=Bartonella sp. AA81SXKL TaxID=3243438 RepID=UPI0035CF7B50
MKKGELASYEHSRVLKSAQILNAEKRMVISAHDRNKNNILYLIEIALVPIIYKTTTITTR